MAFLWSDLENVQSPLGYALQVVDIIDGEPKYVLNAAKAAVTRTRGDEDAVWKKDNELITNDLKTLYQKVDTEFPEVETPANEFKGLSELSQGVQDFALAATLRKLREGLGTMSAK